MLTPKLWMLLHAPAAIDIKWLATDVRLNVVEEAAIIITVCLYPFLCMAYPPIFIPLALFLILNSFCLNMAWKVSGVISKQVELGRWELLAATPRGAFVMMIDFCRVHAQFNSKGLNDLARVLLVLGAVLAGVLTIIGGPSMVMLIIGIILILSVITCVLVVEYRQSLVLGSIVGALASTTGERSSARFWAITGCISVQLLCYAAFFIVFAVLQSVILYPMESLFKVLGIMMVSLASPFIAREVILYGLWHWLLRRVDDDIV